MSPTIGPIVFVVQHLESKGLKIERIDPRTFPGIRDATRTHVLAERKSRASGVVSKTLEFENIVPEMLARLENSPDLAIAVLREAADSNDSSCPVAEIQGIGIVRVRLQKYEDLSIALTFGPHSSRPCLSYFPLRRSSTRLSSTVEPTGMTAFSRWSSPRR